MTRLRSEKHPRRGIPAVDGTGSAQSEERRLALLSGFQMHVAKPVDAAELLAVLASLINRR